MMLGHPDPCTPTLHLSRSDITLELADRLLIMRLLQLQGTGEFSLVEFINNNIPQYAILSHI
jgi:hypothetical protein